jgi:hypothetical protein
MAQHAQGMSAIAALTAAVPPQVPLIKWLGAWSPVRPLLARLAVPLTRLMFAQAGLQLFMADGKRKAKTTSDETNAQTAVHLPLLVLMAFDCERAPFYSALAAFQSRTCYANVESDHLVSWANSSLRFLIDLPPLALQDQSVVPQGHAKGVVRADTPSIAFAIGRAHGSTAAASSETALHPGQAHADFAVAEQPTQANIANTRQETPVLSPIRSSFTSSGAISDEHVQEVRRPMQLQTMIACVCVLVAIHRFCAWPGCSLIPRICFRRLRSGMTKCPHQGVWTTWWDWILQCRQQLFWSTFNLCRGLGSTVPGVMRSFLCLLTTISKSLAAGSTGRCAPETQPTCSSTGSGTWIC